MTANAAARLGIEVAIFDLDPDCPAAQVTSRFYQGDIEDSGAVLAFGKLCDAITLENEWVSPATLELLETDGRLVWPSSATMALTRDKVTQKKTFAVAGLAVPRFQAIDSVEEAHRFATETPNKTYTDPGKAPGANQDPGYPLLLKKRTGGYDGYGNRTVRSRAQLLPAATELGLTPGRLMVEEFVRFDCELAVMVVGERSGETTAYTVVETVQENHICKIVRVPAAYPDSVLQEAASLAEGAVRAIRGVGIFGVELFLCGGRVLLNEIAPRPHNSGHYTLDACLTSQFENHIRAVLGWPLGDVSLLRPSAVMVNLLGNRSGAAKTTAFRAGLVEPEARLHMYGKAESRPGRKMGHVTVMGDDPARCERIAKAVDDALRASDAL